LKGAESGCRRRRHRKNEQKNKEKKMLLVKSMCPSIATNTTHSFIRLMCIDYFLLMIAVVHTSVHREESLLSSLLHKIGDKKQMCGSKKLWGRSRHVL
jgi:hypothetical protein